MQKSKEEMRKMEQYAEAVASALAGNQEGYDFLYQSTYQKKFFIAKKYMGNDMDAQDVLQDAYVQVWNDCCKYGEKCASEKENAVLLRPRRCK